MCRCARIDCNKIFTGDPLAYKPPKERKMNDNDFDDDLEIRMPWRYTKVPENPNKVEEERDMTKTFFVVSAMKQDSSHLGHLKKFDEKPEAVAHAKEVIAKRDKERQPAIRFYVLKAVAVVEPMPPVVPPTKVTDLK